MKINTKQIIFEDEIISNKIISVRKCCDRMISENNFKLCSDFNTNEFKVCYPIREIVTSWDDIFDDIYYYGMDYCPFCGEKIEIESVETEDITAIVRKAHSFRCGMDSNIK